MLRVLFWMLILVLMMGWVAGITTVSEARHVAAWLFNEGTGNIIRDCSGNGNDGTITGGEWIGGVFNGALYLDADSFIEVPNPGNVLTPPEVITVLLWTYITDLPNSHGGIPRLMDSGDAGGWVLHPSVGGDGYQMCLWAHIGSGWTGLSDPNSFPFSTKEAAEWHHFAGVHDGQTLKLYIDGVQVGETAAVGAPNPADGNMRFSHEFSDRVTVCGLDECLITGETLSEADISDVMTRGLAAWDPSITAVDRLGKLAVTWGALKR
jgi:hypothetical protein